MSVLVCAAMHLSSQRTVRCRASSNRSGSLDRERQLPPTSSGYTATSVEMFTGPRNYLVDMFVVTTVYVLHEATKRGNVGRFLCVSFSIPTRRTHIHIAQCFPLGSHQAASTQLSSRKEVRSLVGNGCFKKDKIRKLREEWATHAASAFQKHVYLTLKEML